MRTPRLNHLIVWMVRENVVVPPTILVTVLGTLLIALSILGTLRSSTISAHLCYAFTYSGLAIPLAIAVVASVIVRNVSSFLVELQLARSYGALYFLRLATVSIAFLPLTLIAIALTSLNPALRNSMVACITLLRCFEAISITMFCTMLSIEKFSAAIGASLAFVTYMATSIVSSVVPREALKRLAWLQIALDPVGGYAQCFSQGISVPSSSLIIALAMYVTILVATYVAFKRMEVRPE